MYCFKDWTLRQMNFSANKDDFYCDKTRSKEYRAALIDAIIYRKHLIKAKFIPALRTWAENNFKEGK